MTHQLLEIAAATGLLILIAAPPGYFALRALHLTSGARILDGILGTMAGLLVLPLFYNILGVAGALPLVVRLMLWLLLTGILAYTSRKTSSPTPLDVNLLPLFLIGGIAVFLTVSPLALHDVKIEGRWVHMVAGDWGKHIPVAAALTTDDNLPPKNPFLSTETDLRYYYFAYILPGMVAHGSGISATNSLIALAGLVAFGFPFVLYAYGRQVGLSHGGGIAASSLVTLVSGLDFLYVYLEQQKTGFWPEHIDFWANHDLRRINALVDMFIWTPQHVLALFGFVFVLWLFEKKDAHPETNSSGENLRFLVGTAIFVAATCGTSAFVWFGLGAGLGIWALVEGIQELWRRQFPRRTAWIIASLALSALMSLPYLAVVGGREESAFRVEISPTVSGWRYGGIFSEQFGGSPLTYALDFPFQMAVEFGLVMVTGLFGLWAIRRNWREQRAFQLWGVLLIVFFLIVLVVRPDRADSNNYAARVAPMAWILLGLLSGFWWMSRQRWWLYIPLVPLLIIGIASTLYEPFIQQAGFYGVSGIEANLPAQHSVPESQYEVFQWLNENLGRDDVYQFGWESVPATFFVERRAGSAAGYLALLYAQTPGLYYFNERLGLETGFLATDPKHAANGFQSVDIDYVIVAKDGQETPPLASQPDSAFSRHFKLRFENELYEVYEIDE
jgi:hypothetical protein